MENRRRSFLKSTTLVALVALIPPPVKAIAGSFIRRFAPWAFGHPTMPSIRALEIIRPSPGALAAIQFREQAIARGVSQRTAIRWQWEQRDGQRAVPHWFDPKFRPSLRNVTPPHAVR